MNPWLWNWRGDARWYYRAYIFATCNPLTCAARCMLRGHDYQVSYTGAIGLEVTSCAYCGSFGGWRRTRDRITDARDLWDPERKYPLERA